MQQSVSISGTSGSSGSSTEQHGWQGENMNGIGHRTRWGLGSYYVTPSLALDRSIGHYLITSYNLVYDSLGGTKEYMMESMIGVRFGGLVVLSQQYRPEGNNRRVWCECRCDCGRLANVNSNKLKSGRTRSCGCLKDDHPPPKPPQFPFGVAAKHRVLNEYRSRSRLSGREFSLSDEQVFALFESNCHYCNTPPSNVQKSTKGRGDYVYNGIDRINNLLGYTPENSVSCCRECNLRKRDTGIEDFLEWVRRVYLFRGVSPLQETTDEEDQARAPGVCETPG